MGISFSDPVITTIVNNTAAKWFPQLLQTECPWLDTTGSRIVAHASHVTENVFIAVAGVIDKKGRGPAKHELVVITLGRGDVKDQAVNACSAAVQRIGRKLVSLIRAKREDKLCDVGSVA